MELAWCAHLYQESDSLPTIKETVIVCQSQVHHLKGRLDHALQGTSGNAYWSDFNLAINCNRLLLDRVKT